MSKISLLQDGLILYFHVRKEYLQPCASPHILLTKKLHIFICLLSICVARATLWFCRGFFFFCSYHPDFSLFLESGKGLTSAVLRKVWTLGRIDEYDFTFWKAS